jgi:putative membrane protein
MNKNTSAALIIGTLSLAIPGLVAILAFSPVKITADYVWVKDLPAANAFINSTTAIFLLMGRYYARQQEIMWHKAFMSMALALGTLFLLSYVVYHASSPSAIYGDTNLNGVLDREEGIRIGNLRYFYLALLLSHIGMSVVVVPLVLSAFYYALAGKIEKHLKVVKYTWPIWMFVSVTGVLVYFMVSPYYPN